MPITRIPNNPSPEELAELVSMLPPDGVCRTCGRWRCSSCGAERSIRNRFYPHPHQCASCKSLDGEMLPSRHRDPVDHFIGFIAMSVDEECSLRYPVAAPIPEVAQQLIDSLREVTDAPS